MHTRSAALALVVVVVGLVVAVLGLASPAGAADAPGRTIEVDAGWSGRFQPGEPVPVRVRVTADRLIAGRLQVQVGNDDGSGQFGTAPSVAMPVEVPGGSVKEYLVVVPTTLDASTTTITASLLDGGTTLGEGEAQVEPAGDTELVGLLPGALAGRPLPGTAPLAVDAGTAQFSAVDPVVLATPGALSSLDVLGVAPGELATLDQPSREKVLTWVSDGGSLLVDDVAGTDVAGLPPPWQPGDDGRSRAGLGEVRTAGGALANGAFAGLVEPTPSARSGSEMFGGGEPIDAALARDAGLRVPELGWLVGFLAVYVLVAVPLTLTVLRRLGRGELGWVVLPLVSLVFTGGGYLAGRDLRDDTATAHGTVLALSDVGAQATTSIGVVSNTGGTVGTTFPAGWMPVGSTNQWWGPTAPVVAEPTNDGIELRQDLPPGSFGVRTATGPATVEGSLEITATSAGDVVRGTVRNTLAFDLQDVALFQGQDGILVGDLASGAEADFELSGGVNGDPFSGPARLVWSDASGWNGPPDPDSIVAFPLWESFDGRSPSSFRSAGSVTVAGWTREFTPPVEDVTGTLTGTTLVVATAAVGDGGVTADGVPDGTLRTQRVRPVVSVNGFGGGGGFVFRATSPGEGVALDASNLVVRAPQQGLDLELWRDGGWQPVEGWPPPPDAQPQGIGPFGPMREVPLPQGAVTGGAVWLRATPREIDPFVLQAADVVTVRRAP